MAHLFPHPVPPGDHEPGAAGYLAGAACGPNGTKKGNGDIGPQDEEPEHSEDDTGDADEDLDINPFTDFPVRPDDQ